MAFLFACDRCGAIMRREDERWYIELNRPHLPEVKAARSDLCPSCVKAFDQFMGEMPARDAHWQALVTDE
jgi:hypothetical protein